MLCCIEQLWCVVVEQLSQILKDSLILGSASGQSLF